MKYFLILSIFFSSHAFAADAIVRVLQAPLLKEAKYDSVILQYVRKGERVYVPNPIASLEKWPEFVETFDRAGNTAYVPSRYLKIISNDETENSQNINYGANDPTDYRLEEPIPTTYPFNNYSFLKTSISWTLGNNTKSPYDYGSTFTRQEYFTEKGARLTVLRRVAFDNYDRFYFGLFGSVSTVKNYYEFTNGGVSTENRSLLRVGPLVTFDTYKNLDLRITLGTGFTYNYQKATIQRTESNGDGEERLFSGFSLSPFVTACAQFENIIPNTDLIIGSDFNFFLSKNLTAVSKAELLSWPSDVIREESKPQATIYIGAQFKY